MHYILEEWELKGEKGEGGEGEFRLKEIVFYNLFLFLFDIIEILIMKIIYFSKIYKLYTPLFKDKPGSQQLHAIVHFKDFMTPTPPLASKKIYIVRPRNDLRLSF